MSSLLKKIILQLLILVSSQIFLSCNEDVCNLPNGNQTSDLLARVSREHNYDYCNLLEAALKGNKDSIKKLALLDLSDAAGYDHGAVLVKIILKVGNSKFINAISNISKHEKGIVEGYLNVGLEYGNDRKYERSSLKEVFPDIYSFLNS